MKYDIIIIGCGITGASIAMELSKYKLNVLVLEKENDVAMGTTKANSAIIHAGFDPRPKTKMARLIKIFLLAYAKNKFTGINNASCRQLAILLSRKFP